MTGTLKILGDGASDESRGSGEGDVHSGNVYRVSRLTRPKEPWVFRTHEKMGWTAKKTNAE